MYYFTTLTTILKGDTEVNFNKKKILNDKEQRNQLLLTLVFLLQACSSSSSTSSNSINIINGTPGDDVLNGVEGVDEINGLAGDDTINAGAEDTVDGGADFDTLEIDFDLDLTTLADDRISNIEKIDITGAATADNMLTLNSAEITASGGFDLTGDTTLIVEGNSGDSVLTTDYWEASTTTVEYGGTSYNSFIQGDYQLLISQDINTTGINQIFSIDENNTGALGTVKVADTEQL